jgi:Spy/CpxP family protein refolding chaperone
MKHLITAAIALAIGTTAMVATPAMADPRDDHHGDQHGGPHGGPGGGWHKGDRFDRNQWRSYRTVDYRSARLRPPPRGYEWRRVDNNYVLAAVATGVIADIVLAH